MKKRLKKKLGIVKWCPNCNQPMKKELVHGENDPNIGYYETKGKYWHCTKCGLGYWEDYHLYFKQEQEFEKKASELLLKNYPPDKCEYLTEEEIVKEQRPIFRDEDGCPPFNDESMLIDLRYYVFNTEWNGKRIYLKKSYEMFKEKTDGFYGWFDITKPYSESN